MPIHGIAWGRKSLWSRLSGLGLIGLVLVLILSACGGGGPTNNPQVITQHIKHIVFFVKENRTFDNYFGTYPGANGATSAMDSEGNVVPLHHESDQVPDVDHSSEGARMAYDNGKMDRFDLLKGNGQQHPGDLYGNNSLTQFQQSDIPNY